MHGPAPGYSDHSPGLTRGFVDHATMPADDLFDEVGAHIFANAPIQRLRLDDLRADHAAALARTPYLANLDSLTLTGPEPGPTTAARLGDAGLATLLTSRHLGRLRHLTLVNCGIGRDGFHALAAAATVSNLTELTTRGNRDDPLSGWEVWSDWGPHQPRWYVDTPLNRELRANYGNLPWLGPLPADDR